MLGLGRRLTDRCRQSYTQRYVHCAKSLGKRLPFQHIRMSVCVPSIPGYTASSVQTQGSPVHLGPWPRSGAGAGSQPRPPRPERLPGRNPPYQGAGRLPLLSLSLPIGLSPGGAAHLEPFRKIRSSRSFPTTTQIQGQSELLEILPQNKIR